MMRTTAQRKISHIAIMRSEGCVTQQVIREKLNLSDFDYGNIVFEAGIAFLEDLYSDDLKEFRTYMQGHKMFWKWWKNEWALWEQAFMTFGYNDAITVSFYKQWIKAASDGSVCMSSFAQLLKILRDDKI